MCMFWCLTLKSLLSFSHQAVSNSLQPRGLQHTGPPCPSSSPGVCPSSCALNRWCYPTISSSVALFSFCLRSFPAPRSLINCQTYFSQAKTDIELNMSGPEEWAHSDCKMSFCSGQDRFSFKKQLASLGHWMSAAFVAPALLKVPERRVTNAQRTSAWQSVLILGNV